MTRSRTTERRQGRPAVETGTIRGTAQISPGRLPAAGCGAIVGTVVDPLGRPLPARVIVRDRNHTAVREVLASGVRTGWPGGRFEVTGLPPDEYHLEIAAPGHCWAIRFGVTVEAACDTHLGTVQLMRGGTPGPAPWTTAEASRHPPPVPAWRAV